MIKWSIYNAEYQLEHAFWPDKSRWSISPRREEKFVVKASFQLGHPVGFDFRKEMKRWDGQTVDEQCADLEYQRLFAMMSSQSDVLTAPTVPLIKEVIERFHADDVPEGTWEEIVLRGGFKKARYGQGFDLKLPKGYIEISARKGEGLWMTYQENRRSLWWNLLIINVGDAKWPTHFPKSHDEMQRIGAQFVVDRLVDFVKETEFHKKQPRATKTMGNLMDMMARVDEVLKKRGHGDQRDYSRSHHFNFKAHGITLGIPADRADAWYQTSPNDMTPEERAISDKCREASDAYRAANPYRDYWHFMLEHLPDLENDIKMKICFQVFADAATEDWQKEIAQIYLDLFGAKEQVVEVSW